jgi:hypothetical protein
MSRVELARSPQSATSRHGDSRARRRRLWRGVVERSIPRRRFLSFWWYQLRTQWRNLNGVSLKKRIVALLDLSRDIRIRHHSATSAPTLGVGIADDEKLTVILLNHKRPQNVGQIARYVLRAGFVGRLVISNNDQAYPIENYVGIEDSRLVLIDHAEPTGPGISFELARDYASRYYLRIDDDIFLHPAQLQWLYWCLRTTPNAPHGIFGAAFSRGKKPATEWPFDHRRYCDGSVDILNGLFAFTQDHLREYSRLCTLLGIVDRKRFMNGEDIVMSFAGNRKAMIHNIGKIWECSSEAAPGVALHRTRPRFYEERWKIFSALEGIKPLSNRTGTGRWASGPLQMPALVLPFDSGEGIFSEGRTNARSTNVGSHDRRAAV